MREFPDRFKVIDAGRGARGANGSIVTPLFNLRNPSNYNGLCEEDDGFFVRIIKSSTDKMFIEANQIWRISKDATYEKI